MYVPTTLNQPAGALAPVEIVSTAEIPSLARTAINVSSSRLNVLAGHAATVTGTLRPGLSGRVIMLQTLGSRGWSTVSRARNRAKGRFELHFLTRRTGSERVRVRFAGDASELGSHRRLGWLNTFRLAGASWYGGGGSLACGGSLRSAPRGGGNKNPPR